MKHAPKSIDELIFDSREHQELINNFITNESINGNLLLHGSHGLGKTVTAEILINTIIKAQNDLFISKERSVKEIREQIIPFIQKKPIKSKQKIVYIEEMDKLHKDAFNILKTNTLEKYQHICSFIACTNYIKKIEPAVQSRFNYIISFTGNNIDGIINRLKYILNIEKVKYDENNLINFINTNYKIGIRNLINILQNNALSNNNEIDFDNMSTAGSIENNIIELIKSIIINVIKMDSKNKKLSLDYPENSVISNEYKELVILINNNTDINYYYIYEQLYNSFSYIPIKMVCGKYAEQQEFKYFPHLNLLGFYYEVVKCVCEINRF
jgi:DNA polymerase III delta prime subunit